MYAKTLAIKLGTSVLTNGGKALDRAHMVEIVRACARVRAQGHRVVIVTSGAIAAGREHLGHPDLPPTLASKQLLAAVGQTRLIQLWEQLFALYGLHIGQMLLTRADLEDRERFLNARDTMHALLEQGIIPVVNENDAVAVAEIKVGDNDTLSALVAVLAGADPLLLLTDQEGLYTADPRTHPEAALSPRIEHIDASVYALAGGSVSGLGTGGMRTKIQAAEMATRAGISLIIASGKRPDIIERVLTGEAAGTLFPPASNPLEWRKRWLLGAPSAGRLVLDQGAAGALRRNKSSLLPAGILEVSGSFSRGEVVRMEDENGLPLAQGMTRYGSESLTLIRGKRSADIGGILGYEHGPVAVHRDDLIILGDDI
jgi:glutamate 5-kinase